MQKPSVQEALVFTNLVKQRFLENPSKFEEYASIMRDLRAKHGDYVSLILKLKKIFTSHQDLLLRLDFFLPKLFIPLEDLPKKSINSTMEFVNKIRNRCDENNDGECVMFTKFCNIMGMYQEKKMTVHEVDIALNELFRYDPDLYVEFTRFEAEDLSESSDKDEFDVSGFEFLHRYGKGEDKKEMKNLYDETMFLREFHMFEVDMIKERFKRTLEKMSILDEQFDVLDISCIQQLYCGPDGEGEEIIRIFWQNPVYNARIAIARLQKKIDQLQEYQNYSSKVWADVLEDVRQKRSVRHIYFLKDLQRKIHERSSKTNDKEKLKNRTSLAYCSEIIDLLCV